ncbi:MAG: helix-turn-helix domain-containing protein [Candidatus Aenigmatarchaeota archaeon]
MEKEEIIKTLQKFGLTEYEAKTYVALSLLGLAKASEISKQACVPQSKIYTTLESLMEKQLVETSGERPKLFKAVTPRFVIRSLLEAKEKEFRNLREKAFLISRLLRPIEVDEELVEGIWVQKTEKYMESLDKLIQLLKKARRFVYELMESLPYSSSYRRALLEAKARGVKLHLITTNLENWEKVKWYLRSGIKLKLADVGMHPRIIVIDGEEAIVRLEDGNKLSFHSIWSKDPSFVNMLSNYMRSLWERGKEVKVSKSSTLIYNSLT